MIPQTTQSNQVQSYVGPTSPVPVRTGEVISQEVQQLFTVGEQLHALVSGALPNGRFAVMVKDQMLDLNLPRGTEPGAQLDLEVIDEGSQLTFLLKSAIPSPATSENPLLSDSTSVSLSEVGTVVGSIAADQSGGNADSVVINGGKPLIGEAAPGLGTIEEGPLVASSNETMPNNLASLISTNLDVKGAIETTISGVEIPVADTGSATGSAVSSIAANTVATSSAVDFSGPIDTGTLAEKLQSALNQSGVFYESHLARWIGGDYPQQSLLAEPQAHQGVENSASSPARTPAETEAVLNAAIQDDVPGSGVQMSPGSSTGQAALRSLPLNESPSFRAAASVGQVGATKVIENEPATSESPKMDSRHSQTASVPDNLRQLVHQQLNSIEQRQLNLHGVAWPGQAFQWAVGPDGQRNQASAEQQTGWWSKLHLDLPSLGGIDATVRLQGKQVNVNFTVADPESAALIKSRIESLQNNMEAAGLKVIYTNVVIAEASSNG